jgi:hypothetical protein
MFFSSLQFQVDLSFSDVDDVQTQESERDFKILRAALVLPLFHAMSRASESHIQYYTYIFENEGECFILCKKV